MAITVHVGGIWRMFVDAIISLVLRQMHLLSKLNQQEHATTCASLSTQ